MESIGMIFGRIHPTLAEGHPPNPMDDDQKSKFLALVVLAMLVLFILYVANTFVRFFILLVTDR
jgi:hypothetical protein